MSFVRRTLGVFVMIAGVIGLVLSLAGLVGMFALRPAISRSLDSTLTMLISTVDTSQDVMTITYDALGATIESVDALSVMLDTTATTVADTQPVVSQVNELVGEALPT
ncbi:MAG TPA: hypothetical protein PKN11_09375, partial [Anaerolineaceae bacterium]|nr:hypothetical protein [Anaerolineaceae bacterium]